MVQVDCSVNHIFMKKQRELDKWLNDELLKQLKELGPIWINDEGKPDYPKSVWTRWLLHKFITTRWPKVIVTVTFVCIVVQTIVSIIHLF